jgi:hypothetical protein
MTDDVTPSETLLLEWLSKEDFSQYGECHGRTLDRLVERGFAQVHKPGEHQRFIANDFAGTKGDMYRAVSLTDAGRAAVATIKKGAQP